MRPRQFVMTALAIGVLAVGGCTKGCSCGKQTGDQTVTEDGQPKPLPTLPGHSTEGTLNIHPYDTGLPGLYGPFYVDRPESRELRIINGIGQAVNGAKMTVDLQPNGGEVKKEACEVLPEPEKAGVYKVTCTYDKAGDWDVTVHAEMGNDKGKLGYQVFVRPLSALPTPTATPTSHATAAPGDSKQEKDSDEKSSE